MMKVVGEEGTSMDDYMHYLKAEFLDAVYLQQDAFDPIDSATSAERQKHVFAFYERLIGAHMRFEDKAKARRFFHQLTQTARDWNHVPMAGDDFGRIEKAIATMVAEVAAHA
jgi:V/A-type H+-transporting ATPase subunit A